ARAGVRGRRVHGRGARAHRGGAASAFRAGRGDGEVADGAGRSGAPAGGGPLPVHVADPGELRPRAEDAACRDHVGPDPDGRRDRPPRELPAAQDREPAGPQAGLPRAGEEQGGGAAGAGLTARRLVRTAGGPHGRLAVVRRPPRRSAAPTCTTTRPPTILGALPQRPRRNAMRPDARNAASIALAALALATLIAAPPA